MLRETVTPLVLATLVVLAGCAGAMSGAPGGSADDTGTVNFYISDERNAIDDFEHLNVTIEKVGFKQADSDDEMDDNETEDDETTTTVDNETTTTADNETTTTVDNETTTAETEDDGDDADESEDEESDGWTVREVDNVTIDLTEYQGENATLLSEFDIPNGTYTNVYVEVSEVNGTLTSGEQVNVKLPSQKLKLNKEFTVGNGESVDFVFDITVFKAGNSGKYILKPVVSQSGTDVPIEADEHDDESDDGGPPEDAGEDGEAELNASFVGNVTPGEEVTISVTENGSAVAGAQVFVDDRRVGQTGEDGTLSVMVPDDADGFDVEVRYQDAEAELEVEFDGEDDESTTTTAAA